MSTTLAQNYQECLEYLYQQLPMFSKYGKGAIKNGLDNITKLCAALDNPQEKLKTIHIAGTNGKGSVSHMLAAIAQEAGYTTGLYTSPHLKDFGERIKINGVCIAPDWVVNFVQNNKHLFAAVEPSFFEVSVAMAYSYFADQKCDLVIVETGLGGRLDSTNIITPILSVITNISYDHMDILGDTLGAIAEEKAGIIKPSIPFVIGQRQKETEQVFFEHAIHKQCNSFYADAQWALVKVNQDSNYQYLKAVRLAQKEMYDLKTDLLGHYQLYNIKTALTAAEVLHKMGYNTDINTTLKALSSIKKSTGLRGRWEKISDQPLIIIDVAHNKAGVEELMKQWQNIDAQQKHIVLGFVKDKDIDSVLSYFPPDCTYYFCQANIPRALDAMLLKDMALVKGLNGEAYAQVAQAVQAAKINAQEKDAVLITGSFFVIGEALNELEK